MNREQFLALGALAAMSVACGAKPDDGDFSLVSNSTSQGIHFLFLKKGDEDPSVGAYASVFRRESLISIPTYEHKFASPDFYIRLQLGYDNSNNMLTLRTELQNPKSPRVWDGFVTAVGLPPDSLSFLIFTWRGFKFNPSFILNNLAVYIDRSGPYKSNST